jgi:hypothetical protein
LTTLLNTHCLDNHRGPLKKSAAFWDVMRSSDESKVFWPAIKWTPERVLGKFRRYGEDVASRMDSDWKTIGGRPVLFQGQCHSLLDYTRDFGIAPDELTAAIREGAQKDVYLVATCTDPKVYRSLKVWGFDAFTEYLLYASDWNAVMNIYREYWAKGVQIAKETGMHYWVPVTTGFDSSAWYDHPNRFVPTPEQFTAHLKEAVTFALANWTETRGEICIEAWNEFGEGSYLEPSIDSPEQLHPGDEMLRATRTALL